MKKFAAAFIAILISIVICSNSLAADIALKDIQGHWANSDIMKAVSSGYIKGYSDSTFRPDNKVSRAEFVTMLNMAFSVPVNTAGVSLKDVKNTDWYAKNIYSAIKAGYVDGYPDNTFKPDQFITREEAACLVVNLTKITGTGQKSFKDSSKISKWAQQAVNVLTSAGIMSGYPDGSFKPGENLTRAEAVSIINKAKVKYPGNSENSTVIATPVHLSLCVTGSLVNIRSGPGTSYEVVGKAKKGDILAASEHSANDWYKVQFNNSTGWITGEYTKKTTDINRGDDNRDNSGGTDNSSNMDNNTSTENSTGKLVVIDPGHGGYDPGAIGTGGTYEKDINLAIALNLNNYLKNAGYRVLMTRTDDSYVSLDDRSKIANDEHADIFVSIHCNALDHKTSGTTTYTEPLSGNPVYKQQDDSKRLARLVQDELIQALGLPNRGVREEGLSVCRETNAPAILVETAFIDNKNDEKLLKDSKFQENAAEAIGHGIDSYFAK